MESTGRTKGIQTRTEIQVISIAQDDLRSDVLLQLLVIHTLDGTHGPDGHEDGSMDDAVIGRDGSATGGTARIGGGLEEIHRSYDF